MGGHNQHECYSGPVYSPHHYRVQLIRPSFLSRNTQGVKIITPKEGEKLIECVTIPNEDSEEEE
mgnify:CR=1 FL=1